MTDGVHGGDASWVQWALGGVASAGAVVCGWLYARIEGVRREDARARAKLWDRLNKQSDDAGEARLDDARTYATGADLDKLEERLGERLSETETRIMDAIRDRPPVKAR
jgi:hypothetical protein